MYEPKEFFDKHAAVWDQRQDLDAGKIHAMLQLSDIAPHSVILDVGCGTGVLEPFLLPYVPSAILGVDFAKSMIETAREKINHPAVRFVCADILDVTDLQCDLCFVYNTFPHFRDPERMLAHISTLVRPGGRITISHTQGTRTHSSPPADQRLPPAHGIPKLLASRYHVDAVIDNNAMLLVSAIRR